MARVKLDQISRRFGRTVGIADITFEIPDGEFWVLVGPSGCGKSTILRTIAGLEAATSGDLYIGDRHMNAVPARQRDVAMVFQNYALYPHMSVAENLAFGLRMRQVEAGTVRTRVAAVAQMLDIAHLLERLPQQLSGGQQQRVALGRAIARQPQVFLLDEPLSNLDAQLRDGTRVELKQLHQRVGITTVYVTHDQVEAMTLADCIVVLDQGRIQQVGTPQMIYHYPANRMVATFLGNPPMNILAAIYQGDQWHMGDQSIAGPVNWQRQLQLVRGQRYDLGIRPEHLRIATDPAMLKAEVTVIEPLGRETLVRTRLVGTDQFLTLWVEPSLGVQVGDRLGITLDLAALRVFDATTGLTLG